MRIFAKIDCKNRFCENSIFAFFAKIDCKNGITQWQSDRIVYIEYFCKNNGAIFAIYFCKKCRNTMFAKSIFAKQNAKILSSTF